MNKSGHEFFASKANGYYLSYLGLFLLLSFSTSFNLFLEENSIADTSLTTRAITLMARMVTYLLIALFSRRIGTLNNKKVLLNSALITMVFGTALIALIPLFPNLTILLALRLLVLICIDASYAVLYLAWVELYSKMAMRMVLLSFSLVSLLSSVLSFFLGHLSGGLIKSTIFVILPLLSVLLLYRSTRAANNTGYLNEDTLGSKWSIPFRPIVLLAAYGFANFFIRHSLTTEHKGLVLLGVCAASILVLVLIAFRYKVFELRNLYLTSIPLMVSGALCAIIGLSWFEVLGAFLSNAAFTFFLIFVTVIFCSMSYRYGINSLWLFGFAQAALTAGSMTAVLVDYGFKNALTIPNNQTIALAALVVILLVLSMNLISNKDFTTTWGITWHVKPLNVRLDAQEELLSICSSVSQRYSLTRREEEILFLLAQGQTLTSIGEKLFIADSTMKTHSRHIYRKLNVANKQELLLFIKSLYGG